MNHNLDFFQADIEKPARFDHLEALVHERGGVNRNSIPHPPIWMRQGLLWCCFGDFRDWCGAEWTARGGEHQTLNFAPVARAEALVDGVVFAVHGEKRDILAFHSGHYDFAGSYEDFFISKRDGLSQLDGFVGSG